VAVPQAQMDGMALRTVTSLTAVSLLLLALGTLAALGVARRIAGPIEALRRSAERLGRNEEVAAPPCGTEEIDAVQRELSQASAQLRELNAQLERRVAEAVAKYEQSQRALVQAQKLEALGRLTGGIAHDFNNVLQTMTTSLQAAMRAAPENLREVIARCQRAVARGADLARQLMVFGRVQDVRVQTVDTARRLADATALLQGALPTNIALALDVAPDLWPVTVDPAQLELALLNLVINARDAMPDGGTITIAARNRTSPAAGADGVPGDHVVLSVTDTGHGMSEEVIAHALEPFFTTKKVGSGSGMGLPQAYGFARQSGGTLQLRSAMGQGTTATLLLPRAADAPAEAVAPSAARGDAARGIGHVLLVEDDELVRETVCAALRAAGFDVSSAESADEALRRIEEGERFGAVLTDVVMPGALSGIDLARELRDRHPGIGVVVATGYSDRRVDLRGVRTLPKPYDLQQAVDVLNDLLSVKEA
ncbi:MAG TPA: ATP-binding protein, partial [Albitalea sp.]